MKKYYPQIIVVILGIIGFFYILGWAGRIDFEDQVILHMSQAEYDSIVTILTDSTGASPSQSAIVDYYVDHQ